jgi:hypothetical protein
MDPRDRADAQLARARARGAHVVTPDSATSPMDASNTVQIPRVVVDAVDSRRGGTESTMVLPPGPVGAGQFAQHRGRPQQHAPQQRGSAHQGHQQHGHPAQHNGHHPTGQQQRGGQPHGSAAPASQQPQQKPATRQLPGLVPTVQEPPSQRPTLAERLNGELIDPGEPREGDQQRRG